MNRIKKKLLVGLMGLKNDGRTLVYPNGGTFVKLTPRLAGIIQRLQHNYAITEDGRYRIMPENSPCNKWSSVLWG